MRRALVTGAAGFIGGALVRSLLADGWQVHALLGQMDSRGVLADVVDQVAVHTHDGSMERMLAIMESAKPDVVFHLASVFLSEHQPDDLAELVTSNVLLGTQLVEAMVVTGVTRLVNTGTSWQHFGTTGYRPVNLYAATKQAFEDILAYYHDARAISCITLKLFDTYGPGDRRRKLIQILLGAARTGEALAMSPGGQVLELSHVADVTSAFIRAAQLLLEQEGPILEAYLVAGTRVTLQDLVARLSRATGRPIQVHWGGRPYRSREVMMPVPIEENGLPGWAPIIDLDEGLADLAGA